MTPEMPLEDNDDRPDPDQGWSPNAPNSLLMSAGRTGRMWRDSLRLRAAERVQAATAIGATAPLS